MRIFIAIILIVINFNTITADDRKKEYVSDPDLGLIVLMANNKERKAFGFISIINVETGKVTKLREAIYKGQKGKPSLYRLKPGIYKLYKFQKYANVKPAFKDLDFQFTVEKKSIKYVGDWLFREYWKRGNLQVKFMLSYSEETITKARNRFKTVFNTWPLAKMKLQKISEKG